MYKIPLLITAAMRSELMPVINKTGGCQIIDNFSSKIYPQTIDSQFELYFLETGIGKINASVKTAAAVNKIKPQLILHIGCCGALTDNIPAGTVICPVAVKEHDCKLLTGEQTYNIELHKPIKISNSKLLKKYRLAHNTAFNSGKICAHCGMLSGDSVLLDGKYRDYLYKINNAEYKAIDMESFATATVAEFYRIDLLIYKIIVDNCRLDNQHQPDNLDIDEYYPLKKIASEFYNKQFPNVQFNALMNSFANGIINLLAKKIDD